MSEIGLVLSPMLPINLQTRVVVYTTPLEDNVESSLCLSKPEDCFAYGAASVLVNDVIATHVGSTQTDDDISITVSNLKQMSRVTVGAPFVQLSLDYVSNA